MRKKTLFKFIELFKVFIFILIINIFGTNCSHISQKDDLLKEARETYTRAVTHSKATNVEALSKAKQALENAEKANDLEEIKHLAYLAKQQAQIAITIAKRQKIGTQSERLDKSTWKITKSQPKASRQATIKNRQLAKKLVQWQNHQTSPLMITLNDVFETDKTSLLPQTRDDIETIAKFLKQHPNLKVLIEGHTNNISTHQHNLGLSERYATSIKFVFMEYGITSNRITVKGFGETNPTASNDSKEGHQKNHRVEIIVLR
jgi:outer membrane protein OmpA-like peptidoglycan-associated protein